MGCPFFNSHWFLIKSLELPQVCIVFEVRLEILFMNGRHKAMSHCRGAWRLASLTLAAASLRSGPTCVVLYSLPLLHHHVPEIVLLVRSVTLFPKPMGGALQLSL